MMRPVQPIPLPPLWPDLPPLPGALPRPSTACPPPGKGLLVPSVAQCESWWDRFAMPEHIRAHSRQVAKVACFLAGQGLRLGLPICLDTVRASALLHELATAYWIIRGGSHSPLGGGVSHDRIVPIESRFDDLLARYGSTPEICDRIHTTNRQAKDIEDAFGQLLEIDLNAHDFDSGRLVD